MKAHGDWGQGDKEIPNVSFDRSFIKNSAAFNNSLVYTAGTNSLASYCSMISISNLKEKKPLDVLVNLLKQCFSSVKDLKNFFEKIQEIIDRLNSENTGNNFKFEEYSNIPETDSNNTIDSTKIKQDNENITVDQTLNPEPLAQQYILPQPIVGGANVGYLPPQPDQNFPNFDNIMSELDLSEEKDYKDNEKVETIMSDDEKYITYLKKIRQNLKLKSLEDSVDFLKDSVEFLTGNTMKYFLKFLKKKFKTTSRLYDLF